MRELGSMRAGARENWGFRLEQPLSTRLPGKPTSNPGILHIHSSCTCFSASKHNLALMSTMEATIEFTELLLVPKPACLINVKEREEGYVKVRV